MTKESATLSTEHSTITKRILMIPFEFTPSNGASTQRTHAFYQAFINAGWEVDVLTVNKIAYSNTLNDLSLDTSPTGKIMRTFALDAQRHLAFKGKYLSVTMTPDRWGLTWIPSALFTGTQRIKKHKPDIIWSTAPIPSAHYIGQYLAKKHNIPFVADYRDPMPYLHRPASQWLNKIHRFIDEKVMDQTQAIVFATDESKKCYEQEFPSLGKSTKTHTIENGYSEFNFTQLPNATEIKKQTIFEAKKFNLYYGGALYQDGRDPTPLFKALANVINNETNSFKHDNIQLTFQGSGGGIDFKDLLSSLSLTNVVRFLPPVSFKKSLINMMNADLLVIIQDEKFNRQIPGKLYEYLRTKKNILLKSPENSSTYKVASKYAGIFTGMNEEELEKAILSAFSLYPNTTQCRQTTKHERQEKANQLLTICDNLIKKESLS